MALAEKGNQKTGWEVPLEMYISRLRRGRIFLISAKTSYYDIHVFCTFLAFYAQNHYKSSRIPRSYSLKISFWN